MRENNRAEEAGGFSLIELMIAICILALIVTLGVVNMRYLNKATVSSNLDLLSNTCFYLQRKAMATGQPQELLFDEEHNSYVYNNNLHALPACMHFAVLPHAKGPPSAPQYVLHSPITFAHKKITFTPEGIIGAGTVYILDTDNNLYAMSSSAAHISFLRKYRYDGKWHLIE